MAVWDLLAEGRRPRRYQTGQMVYLQGTEPVCFYYLVSGSVRSFISSPDGGERVLAVFRTGDLMGEASFFDESPRVTSAMAVEDSLIVPIDRQRLTATFERHPELALPMLQYLARTVRMLSAHVDSASLPAEQRVARYLMAQFSHGRGTVSCTHEQIGQAVGASRVTVSRVLGNFVRLGVIRTGYGILELLDAPALKRLCEA